MNLLNMNHPHASIQNILTFIWCLWKSRNDNRFAMKQGAPYQINLAAQAVMSNLEMYDYCDKTMQVHNQAPVNAADNLTVQGSTIKTDLTIAGPKVFSDAAWKTKKHSRSNMKRSYEHWCLLSV